MGADSFLRAKEMGLNPDARRMMRPPGQNPYSIARTRSAPPQAAVPVQAQPTMGTMQPEFSQPQISSDPFEQGPPSLPMDLSRPMREVGLRPGAEDMRTNKYSQDYSRGKNLNVYQDPTEYEQHLNTVMQSPLMQKLAESADQYKQLRSDFLKTAPQQSDLSPTMALADYLAKGKGTAQAGYKRPASYEDAVGHISELLGQENKARQMQAQLAYEQAGGLKKGAEEATNKTGADVMGQKGYKIPQPHMAGMMIPFNQANQFAKNYESNPGVKEVNDEIANANKMEQLLKNPNWYTNRALAGAAVKGMGFNKMTQAEFFTLGGGSQDLWNKASNMVRTGYNGETLSPSDIQTIQDFNVIRKRAALAKREQIHGSYNQGLGSMLFDPSRANGLMGQGDVQPDNAGAATADERSQAIASKLMEQMRGLVK